MQAWPLTGRDEELNVIADVLAGEVSARVWRSLVAPG
jgi:hypothetical protein